MDPAGRDALVGMCRQGRRRRCVSLEPCQVCVAGGEDEARLVSPRKIMMVVAACGDVRCWAAAACAPPGDHNFGEDEEDGRHAEAMHATWFVSSMEALVAATTTTTGVASSTPATASVRYSCGDGACRGGCVSSGG